MKNFETIEVTLEDEVSSALVENWVKEKLIPTLLPESQSVFHELIEAGEVLGDAVASAILNEAVNDAMLACIKEANLT